MKSRLLSVLALLLSLSLPQGLPIARAAQSPGAPHAVKSPRLYVFDCGSIHLADLARLSVTPEETGTSELSVACFLLVHPKGTLMWDVGAVPDSDWTPTGRPLVHRIVMPDGQQRDITLRKPLAAQMRAIGYPPSKVTYLALSHFHYDHTGNANEFAHATWLARKEEHDLMFAAPAPATSQPSSYAALKDAKTIIIDTDDYDVFGDGTAVIKFAPGHTPGHQVLSLNLPHTGRILLSGDLYHFPVERELGRVPAIESDQAQTRASRAAIESFLTSTHAQLWIQHDIRANAALKKAPEYYD